MPALSTVKMTADQFLQLGEDPPGVRLELVDGEIEVSPSHNPAHAFVVMRLARFLDTHIDNHGLGQLLPDVGTVFGKTDVRRPDLLFYRTNRLHLIGDRSLQAPPDLAVEVISPSSITNDRRIKFELYERGGVEHYWIIDPTQRTAEAYALTNGKYALVTQGQDADTLRLPPFVDLDIPLGKLWRPLS